MDMTLTIAGTRLETNLFENNLPYIYTFLSTLTILNVDLEVSLVEWYFNYVDFAPETKMLTYGSENFMILYETKDTTDK